MNINDQKQFDTYTSYALAYYITTLGACYIRNPKCASGSTVHYLKNTFKTPLSTTLTTDKCFYTYNSTHDDNLISFLKKNKVFCFTFARNPYQRILSAYLEKFNWGDTLSRKKSLKKQNPTAFEGISFDNFTFENFIDVLLKNDPYKMDRHWIPQHLLLNFKNIKYHFIGHVENYENDIHKLFESLIKTKKKKKIRAGSRTDSRKKLHDYYTPDLVDKVYKIYKDDFEILGYSKDIDQIDHYDNSKLPQLSLKNPLPITFRSKISIMLNPHKKVIINMILDAIKELIHS